MKPSRLIFWISGALITILVLFFFGWFWSLGTVHAEAKPPITIVAVTPTVEVRHADDADWKTLSDVETLFPGDQIRTGDEGEARITWGDRGYTRIDANTELTVEQAPADGTLTPGTDIALLVESGRVWSRMLKLLDLDSSMEVRTSDVVATVRGTTFGIIKDEDGSQAAVAESVVEISGEKSKTLLRDNQWGSFLSDGSPREVRELGPGDTWAQEHIRKDREDDVKFAKRLREQAERRAATLEGAPLFLVDLSERLHVRLASREAASKLAAAYSEQRLARALVDGESRDWKAFLRYADQAGTEKGELLGNIHAALSARARQDGFRAISAESAFRRQLVADAPEASRLYLDAVALDERIDDAILRPETRDIETLASIAEDLDLLETRIEHLSAESTGDSILRKKTEALRKRLEYILLLLPANLPPTEYPSSAQEESIIGNQIPDPAKAPEEVLKPPPSSGTPEAYVRLSLLATPMRATVGQSVRLSLYGVTADGRADNLTASATFAPARVTDGGFVGPVFTPSVPGTIQLNAMYRDAQGMRSTSVSIEVQSTNVAPNGLQGIKFSFIGSTTLPCSGHSSFKVLAVYGDGRTEDVTMLSKLSVSDAKLIYANTEGNLLSFCAPQVSEAMLSATYTEGQITQSASAVITVEPEPPAATSGGQTTQPAGTMMLY